MLYTFYENFNPWFWDQGIRIVLILIGAFVVHKFGGIVTEKITRKAIKPDAFGSPEAEKKREDTLITVVTKTLQILIWIVAILMVLAEIGINIAPLLAGAGVAGIAIGFGAQALIKDVLGGLFIIMENQYRVGDVVKLNETAGSVEDITLRTTILRDLDGNVHHVPNGLITKTTNLSKEFSGVNLDIGVGYNSDIEKVERVVNQVGEQMAQNEKFRDAIIEAPKFLRLTDFADSAMIIKIVGKTKPLKQWEVTGELRKQLKIAFDREGIEIPFPQRVIHQK